MLDGAEIEHLLGHLLGTPGFERGGCSMNIVE